MKATIKNFDGAMERVNLPAAHYSKPASGTEDYTGIWITGLYSGPRTGRKFVETYSIWQDAQNPQRNVGTTFREVSASDYLDACLKVGCEPCYFTAVEV